MDDSQLIEKIRKSQETVNEAKETGDRQLVLNELDSLIRSLKEYVKDIENKNKKS